MTVRSRPLLLGHRGARATRSIPENTVASFDLCLQHGCDGFELDVRQTADGTPVVCHDEAFRGAPLDTMSAHELAAWQKQGFLPTLEEVLLRFSTKSFLDIELKVSGAESGIVDLLLRYPVTRGCLVTSFLPDVLIRLHELDGELQLGLLLETCALEVVGFRDKHLWKTFPVQWVLPEWQDIDAAIVGDLNALGKRIGAWTVNKTDNMQRLAALGVEMLISDETERLVNTFGVG
jgi:glycerophosphoryl diester phosphodiesterase